jgi:hypothetical protein
VGGGLQRRQAPDRRGALQGITDFRVFTDVHPEFVERCMAEIRVVDVNRQTLTLFRAPDKATLLHRLPDIFRDEMRRPFTEQLIELWEGKLYQQRETVNYALDGEMLHVHLQFAVLPGHEHDWSLVQVSLTDITARKKAEAYLEFLGKHDALTRLRNRSFFDDELNRLERKNVQPVACCCWTSTASSRSTTSRATARATPCCAAWARCWARRSRPRPPRPASAATSSPC